MKVKIHPKSFREGHWPNPITIDNVKSVQTNDYGFLVLVCDNGDRHSYALADIAHFHTTDSKNNVEENTNEQKKQILNG